MDATIKKKWGQIVGEPVITVCISVNHEMTIPPKYYIDKEFTNNYWITGTKAIPVRSQICIEIIIPPNFSHFKLLNLISCCHLYATSVCIFVDHDVMIPPKFSIEFDQNFTNNYFDYR